MYLIHIPFKITLIMFYLILWFMYLFPLKIKNCLGSGTEFLIFEFLVVPSMVLGIHEVISEYLNEDVLGNDWHYC